MQTVLRVSPPSLPQIMPICRIRDLFPDEVPTLTGSCSDVDNILDKWFASSGNIGRINLVDRYR